MRAYWLTGTTYGIVQKEPRKRSIDKDMTEMSVSLVSFPKVVVSLDLRRQVRYELMYKKM